MFEIPTHLAAPTSDLRLVEEGSIGPGGTRHSGRNRRVVPDLGGTG